MFLKFFKVLSSDFQTSFTFQDHSDDAKRSDRLPLAEGNVIDLIALMRGSPAIRTEQKAETVLETFHLIEDSEAVVEPPTGLDSFGKHRSNTHLVAAEVSPDVGLMSWTEPAEPSLSCFLLFAPSTSLSFLLFLLVIFSSFTQT